MSWNVNLSCLPLILFHAKNVGIFQIDDKLHATRNMTVDYHGVERGEWKRKIYRLLKFPSLSSMFLKAFSLISP